MADATVTFAAKDLNLGSTIDKLKRELSATEDVAKNSSKGFDMSFGKIGLAAGVAGVAVKAGMMAVEAATAAASAVVQGFGQAIDLGGQLTDLSSRTGETAGNLLVLQRAFENSGVGADKVGSSINKLQKFISEAGTGATAQNETLSRLGITMSDLAGKTPTEQMEIFAKKIAGISDPTERARIAMDVFGKSGGELLPMLNNFSGEIDGAKSQLGSMPGVMDRSAKAFDDLGDNMDAIGQKTMEFAAGFLEDALPALNAFATALSGVDAAGWGETAMQYVKSVAATMIGAFKDPMAFISAYGTSLEAAAKSFGNLLVNSMSTGIDFLISAMKTSLPSAIMAYVESALVDASLSFSRHLTEAMMTFSAALSDLPGFKEIGDRMFSTLDKLNNDLAASQKENIGQSAEAAKKVVEEFSKAAAQTRVFKEDFFGAEEATKRMNDEMAALEKSGRATLDSFNKSEDSAEKTKIKTGGAAADAEAIAGSFKKAENSSSKMKEDLSASGKLLKSIAESEARDAVDKGGKLAKQAQDSIGKGDYATARSIARNLANNEADTNMRGIGENRDRRSMNDIGKDYGLSQGLGEDSKAFRERIRSAREDGIYKDAPGSLKDPRDKYKAPSDLNNNPVVDKPGQDGKKPPAKDPTGTQKSLDTIVQKILDLVTKIEPRLPVAALTA